VGHGPDSNSSCAKPESVATKISHGLQADCVKTLCRNGNQQYAVPIAAPTLKHLA
jgi:hypothetical protein